MDRGNNQVARELMRDGRTLLRTQKPAVRWFREEGKVGRPILWLRGHFLPQDAGGRRVTAHTEVAVS